MRSADLLAIADHAASPSRGPLSIAVMVDRCPIAYKPVRDVFVHYLTERAAMLDYGSLNNQARRG
jgi:hypothetical protein